MTTKELNELKEQAYNNACEKGFHVMDYSDQHCLMLIITELSESVEAWRKSKRADIRAFVNSVTYGGMIIPKAFETFIKDSVEDELADAVIRTLDLAGLRKIEFTDDGFKRVHLFSLKDGFIEEIYDIVVRIQPDRPLNELCHELIRGIETLCSDDIDLWWHVRQKMRYNKTREYLHGKIC